MANLPSAVRRSGPTTLELVAKARWQAHKRLPYLARLLWALSFIETTEVPTMAVDSRWRVYVNPNHIRECMTESFDCVIEGVLHEGLHVWLRHEARAKTIRATDHFHWNCCGDCELVEHIRSTGLRLWSKGLDHNVMGWPAGLCAEEMYRLPRDPENDNGGNGGQGEGQGGKGKPQRPKPGKPGQCSGGSGATGQPEPWELGDAPGGKPKPAGLSEDEAEIVRAQVAQDIRNHAESHGRGSVPGGLLRWAETLFAAPPINWRDVVGWRVAYHIDMRRGAVASYDRPSRRQNGHLVMPVHRAPRANVFVIGDTSGSMGESDIGKAVAVVWDAVQTLGRVKALGCDAGAAEPVDVQHIDDLREALRGGGGTDMRVGIARAEQDNPDAIVVVTDGDTPWPDSPPDSPVIVVITRKLTEHNQPPAWADVVDASDIEPST